MKIPDYAVTAVKKLNTAGYEAYFVGGCVRDSLRGVTPGDWDITTSALPEETEKALSDYRVIGTGIKHGTVTAIIGGHPLEITTYRIDGEYSDSRRP
ncbi:MAG: tRNA nucleotidyltransferase, partial [Oscillospiraceae bacterium]|nr:tRNA nucleotidyltransferase [Oscillospiraceae bacterium]